MEDGKVCEASTVGLIMFHKAVSLEFREGTTLVLTFQSGEIKSYDVAVLFSKYPQLEALKDRKLFLSGKLMGSYGIYWNEDLDLEVETVYEEGADIGRSELPINLSVADAVSEARAKAGISQSELAARTGIDQSDISKLERGIGNPSISTLSRLASAMGMKLNIRFS